MKPDESLKVDIPVPWSAEPVRVHATGIIAVIAGAAVTALLIVAIVATRPF